MATAPTDFNALLKEDYQGQAMEQLLYADYPFLKLLKKSMRTNFEGKYKPYPVNFAPAGGIAGVFATAQAQASANQDTSVSFFLPAVLQYALTTIPGQVMAASRDDAGGFIRAVEKRMDDTVSMISQRLAAQCWRSGYGDLGVVAYGGTVTGSITNTLAANQIQLTNPSDIGNFVKGTYVDFAAALNTGATRSRGSSISTTGLQVTGVDQSTGILTFSGNVVDATTGVSGVSANDFIFGAGDRQLAVGSGIVPQVMVGMEGWAPSTAPASGESFYGVDRSADRRLAGTSYAAPTGIPLDQVLIRAANKANLVEGKITHYFLNLDYFTELENALATRVRYATEDLIGQPHLGSLEGIILNHARGQILCVADKSVPANRIFGINKDSCELLMMGNGLAPWDGDGNVMLRDPSADTASIRWNMYLNFAVSRPNDFINIQVPVISG